MQSISLNSENAARIVLAVIADKHPDQALVALPALQQQWGQLGLRADDLLQALTLLTREQQLSIQGEAEQAQLILADTLRAELAPAGQGIRGLNSELQALLDLAAQRVSEADSRDQDQERRDGFR